MINVQGLSVIYPDGTKAVDGIGFDICAGESVALAGANGAGKTSLLLALVGILDSEVGKIRVNGMELRKGALSEIRKCIGMVFQNPDDQLFMPKIYDDIAFGPRNMGLTENEVKAWVEEALCILNIEHLRDCSSLKLSGGEKRAAAIATVLSMHPSVVLLDEPTAFLDPKARRMLIDTLNALPHTKLIATHDLSFAAQVCQHALLLKDGSLFAKGGAKELLYDGALMEACGLEALVRNKQIYAAYHLCL